MSTSAVISQVSALLVRILREGLGATDVELTNPADLGTSPKTLSIWLYQVTPSGFLRNAPNVPVGDRVERITPLALDLCYLIIPSLTNESANQANLGRALRVLYDNSILTLRSGTDVEDLHLTICQRSITELAEVWEALQQPYRLSLCFEVRTVRIDSDRTLAAGRVLERGADLQEIQQEAVS